MSLTVQSIVNSVSSDIRGVLAPSGNDATRITDWVDRIHKDCLHSSIYSYLNIFSTSISTVVGTQSYVLTPTNIRRIVGVYDATRDRILFPIERATSPVSQVEKQEPDPGQQGGYSTKWGMPPMSALALQSKQPEFYRHLGGSNSLVFYPIPQAVLTLNVSYEQQVVSLVELTDPLVLPEDAKDIIVAGTNYLANIYLKRAEEAQAWGQIYTQLKAGMSLV